MSKSSTVSILDALAVAGFVGTVIGVLYAPAKGTVTRRALKKKVVGIVEDVELEVMELRDEKVMPMIDNVKKEVKEKISNGIDDVTDFLDKEKKNVTKIAGK